MSSLASATARFRHLYGSGPLHFLLMLSGFALVGYVVVTAGPSMLWKPDGAWWQSMVVWFVAAFIAHDLVLFPIYALADRFIGTPAMLRPTRRAHPVPIRNYVRVPALGTGLLFFLFFPGIIRQGAPLFSEDTGLTQQPFLARWLLLTALMFCGSALSYAIRTSAAHQRSEAIDPTTSR